MERRKEIRKYTLDVGPAPSVLVPEGSNFLSVMTQHRKLVVYFSVDPDKPTELRWFRVVDTGEVPPAGLLGNRFVGTVALPDESWMRHVFLVDE